MADRKTASQKALSRAYPRDEAGMAQLLHAQLYFKYIPLYIWHMRDGLNKFLPDPIDNIKPEGEIYDAVEDMVKTVVNHTGAGAADPATNVYHAKVLRLEDAEQFFQLNEDVDMGELPKSIMPYEHARRILFENPDNIAVIDCVCRTLRGDKGCHPRQVCILIGNPWVDWVMEHVPEMHPRRITQAEALEILHAAHERGDVHAGFFKDAAAGRMYHICNCCSCCCTALVAQNYIGAPMFAGSGYVAQIDESNCAKCGICADSCNFLAITKNDDGSVKVDKTLCKGCEACKSKCRTDAISFKLLDGETLSPLDLKAVKPQIDK